MARHQRHGQDGGLARLGKECRRCISLTAMFGCLLAVPAEAAVYKCKDAAGASHYQDRPCSDGKKPAAFNSSAQSITGTDSQSVYQAGAELDARAPAAAPRRSASASGPGEPSMGGSNPLDAHRREIPAEKCYSGVWKNRTWGCPFKRDETDKEVEARLGREAARSSVEEDFPSAAPPRPGPPRKLKSDPSGSGIIKDTAGDRYKVDGVGRLINRRTGQFCEQQGGNVVCR